MTDNAWIDVNLPWWVDAQGPAQEAVRIKACEIRTSVDALARTVFSSAELEELSNLHWGEAYGIGCAKHLQDVSAIKRRFPLLLGCDKDAAWLKAIEAAITDVQALALARHWHLHWRYNAWQDKLGVWDALVPFQDAAKAEAAASCFSRQAICKPGVLIKVKHHKSGEIKEYLIGDIDVCGYAGGDYRIVENADTVLSYKVICGT